ncbi:MAG: hypothetical protein KBS85_00860 [Lachnospiraceae bacterium]|nr:hypothetical protein [Candidatus Merdinaster equi]
MKKFVAIALGLSMALALVACGNNQTQTTNEVTPEAQEVTETPATETPDVDVEGETPEATTSEVTAMTHAEFDAAEMDSPVVIETYVQATQSWWQDAIKVYAQSEDGAYFIYDMACAEDQAALLVPGTKIRVTGYKTEWSGEVEIGDGTFEIVDDGTSFIASATDVTALLASDDLSAHMNEFVSFKGLTVAASEDAEGNEVAFLYSYDGSGTHDDNSDLYFKVADADGNVYTFTVESYLCNNSTDVYAAVEALNVGDVIDLEGFLYWYNGVNPHITSVTVK